MKKILFLVAFIALFCGVAHSSNMVLIDADIDDDVDLSISGVGTIYTDALKLRSGVYYSTSYQAVSATSTPDVTIEFEESFQLPTTENIVDTTYKVPEVASDLATNLVDEVWHHERLYVIPMKYMRYKITGNAGNATDTLLSIKTTVQEITDRG